MSIVLYEITLNISCKFFELHFPVDFTGLERYNESTRFETEFIFKTVKEMTPDE